MSYTTKKTFIENSAQNLYNLIHARFIKTKSGISLFRDRYLGGEFGICYRVGCGGCFMIPCGVSDFPKIEKVKLYCPRCMDLYHPRHPKYEMLDGCAFGSTFCHLLFLVHPDIVPSVQGVSKKIKPYELYKPKIFGFNVSISSPSGPKMSWLRARDGAQ
jgi:casein kinase II subunit beta